MCKRANFQRYANGLLMKSCENATNKMYKIGENGENGLNRQSVLSLYIHTEPLKNVTFYF